MAQLCGSRSPFPALMSDIVIFRQLTSEWPTIQPEQSPNLLRTIYGWSFVFKPALLKQSLEARLDSKAVPFGIDRQEDQMDITRCVGLLKGVEYLLVFLQASVDERWGIRRHVPSS